MENKLYQLRYTGIFYYILINKNRHWQIPQTWVELKDEQDVKNMNRILDLLDEDDDVQEVYHNWDE